MRKREDGALAGGVKAIYSSSLFSLAPRKSMIKIALLALVIYVLALFCHFGKSLCILDPRQYTRQKGAEGGNLFIFRENAIHRGKLVLLLPISFTFYE